MIASSQVFQVVRPYLPFRRCLTALTKLAYELDALAIVVEDEWFKIGRGEMTEDEVQKALVILKRKKLEIVRKSFESTLPENKKLLAKADGKAREFFSANYGVET